MATGFDRVAKKAAEALNNETFADNAVSFLDELLDRIPTYIGKARNIRETGPATLAEAHETNLAAPPEVILNTFEELREELNFFVKVINAMALYINSRIPEMKEEDNSGVTIQYEVLKSLIKTKSTIQGTDKESSSRLATLNFKVNYLASRVKDEEKLEPTGEKAEPSKSASLKLSIKEADRLALEDLAASYLELRRTGLSMVALFSKNVDKLTNPRRRSGSQLIG